MTDVFLIGCGKRKLGERALARDIYTGGLFRAALRYAESQPNGGVYVLSAKHGLVALGTPLDPYDETLNDYGQDSRWDWGLGVSADLYTLGLIRADVRLVLLAGSAYEEGVRFGVRDLCREDPEHEHEDLQQPEIATPLGRLFLGQRLAWLKANTRQG